ncbi:family 20 glycosylhydrolase, partial [Actinosynnema sp. NPDC059797]
MKTRARALAALVVLLAASATWHAASGTTAARAAEPLRGIVPVPASVQATPGVVHTIAADAVIAADAAARPVAERLAELLRPATGFALPVVDPADAPADGISLLVGGAPAAVGDQGYRLDVTATAVRLHANTAAGLFAGVQTLRQLLPARVEARTPQPGPWQVPGASITDHPRFPHRGAMLDVARHFHPVATVKRYVDQLALYKINYLHLHLTDDQGWRIAIDSWPRLTTHGGSTQVGGGPGGYYTKAQYQEIVAYAAARHITVVPEVDLPGHTNAALSSYAELNCNGVAPALRTDIAVGYSSLCVSKEVTYRFVEDVIREVAAITPGPYLHIGGDEAHATTDQEYRTFMDRVLPLVAKHGKRPMGWHEFAKATTDPAAVAQYWGTTTSNAVVRDAAARGQKVLMSPANKAYLDMKYDASTQLGLSWAGYVEVRDAYEWNPGAHVTGVPESAVLGVEAPLWTETVVTPAHVDHLAFPRLAAIAELGWSPWSTHGWDAFRLRLGAQGPRWTALGIGFYRSPQVPWDDGGTTTTTTTTTAQPSGTWAPGRAYATGDRVTHSGVTYQCRQPHTSQPGWEPP